MIFKKMLKTLSFTIIICFYLVKFHMQAMKNFNLWVKKFKIKAINSGISKQVVDDVMNNAKFLPKVIEYDRFQPEFYEDTFYLY